FETSEGTMLSLDVSPDGGTIVFDMLGDLYALPKDGGDATVLTRGIALDPQPLLSPDGETVLFLSDRSGAENLWLMDAGGANPRQVSFYDDNPHWTSPEWSPDGETIMVTRFWPDRNAYELWQFAAADDPVGQVLRAAVPREEDGEPVSSLGARIAGDGSLVMASLETGDPAFDELSAWTVIRFDPVTGEETLLAGSDDAPAFRPALSPDGETLVFAERRAGETWLRAMDIASGRTRDLIQLDPDSLEASLWHDAIPRYDFTADGKAIVVNAAGGFAEVSLASGEARNIAFTAEVDQPLGPLVRTQIPLEEGPVEARLVMAPRLSPDGGALAFSALGRVYVRDVEGEAEPRLITPDGLTGYHPAWSGDGETLALVSWSRDEGGAVWLADADTGAHEKLTEDEAFYTHPVFTPGGEAIIAVRSPADKRRETYMEFGQLREAELVLMPLKGGAARVLMSGRIGGTPHFRGRAGEVLINTGEGVEAVRLEDGARTLVTQAEGPNWYFAEGLAAADDLRVSPDGRWALAQITQQLYLYELAGEGESVDLNAPPLRAARLTDIGADYFDWSADGAAVGWSVGSSWYSVALEDVTFDAAAPVPVEEIYADPLKLTVTLPRDTPSGAKLLTGANVITMASRDRPGAVLMNADILIDGAKIAAVGPSGSFDVSADAEVVDVTGKWIAPGLIDAHYHLADIRRDVLQEEVWGLKANLALGITTVFDPSSLSIDMLAYQDLVEAGEVTGARLFSTGPAVFDFNDFRSKDEVRAVLTRYRDHYRLRNLKQYRVGNRRVRQWFAEVSQELGMVPTTEGALSFKLGLTHILDGFSGNEHALPPPVLHEDVTRLFAESGTSSTLTLMITHGGQPADKLFIARHDAMNDEDYARLVPDFFRKMRFHDVEAHEDSAFLYRQIAASAHRIHQAGGAVGVGAHGDIPGLGTLWEIEAYVDGGWSPAEALWAATMGSAKAIARDESLGSLEPGKHADLIILDANPLEDVTALRRIDRVFKNGRMYSPEALASRPDWSLVFQAAPCPIAPCPIAPCPIEGQTCPDEWPDWCREVIVLLYQAKLL
ncbi:MAG: amidohydrolase family protein, partial [Henriciella sp.]|uniref:amidohydrolase family protein n=1 Tax=Henriciella sp. TaxID=1968823 RepID=UPI003C7747E8